MKSKYIVLLGLALSWVLASCVSEDKLAARDEPPGPAQVTALAEEPVPEKEDATLIGSASPTPVEPTSIEPVWPSSTAPVEAASPASTAVSRASLPGQYMIQSGDTFRAIAARPGIYWNETLWPNIYNANRDKIANPDLILPGTLLSIPPLRDEIREGMWEANRYYENPFGTGVSGANTTAPAASTNARQTPVQTPAASAATVQTPAATQASARTSANNRLVRRNVVSYKIAGVERADSISYVTLDWTGLGNADGVGMNVRIEAYTVNSMLVGAIVLENSHSYGRWNRYFSVSGEFLTAYSSWNDRIDFATMENNSIQIEHESIGNVFLHMELDGSPFRN
ncbi:MAG: LysM peptidoglycan-binding domain-containing protein [Treponema sp.]|nr:LysM peptidoglycan-binding domain-containing protein [Treponema sp.]